MCPESPLHPTAERYFALSGPERKSVHLYLCRKAAIFWDRYVRSEGPLSYVDGVVGTYQEVDLSLPGDALNAIESGKDAFDVHKRYFEPITAMHDDDLAWSSNVDLAYYAIYNAFEHHVMGRKLDPWLIVNQALSMVATEHCMDLLAEALDSLQPPRAP